MPDFVHARGVGPLTVATSTNTKVPVDAVFGDANLIVGGRFVADRAGIWRFDLKGWANGGQLRLLLVDDSGAQIDFVSYPGSQGPLVNNPIETSFTVLEMAIGDCAWLAVNQASGSTQTVTAEQCAQWMLMHVTYL